MSKVKRLSILTVIIFLLYFFLVGIFPSCKNFNRNKSHADIPEASIEKGKALAATYCGSCHLQPDPSLLDAKTWEKGVLPNMGPRLGIFNYGFETYPSSRSDKNLDPDFYPSTPVLSFPEWQNIIDYYTATSPDTLATVQKREQPIKNELPLFTVQVPAYNYPAPATSFVKIDDSGPEHSLIVSDANRHTLYRYNYQLQLFDSVTKSESIVDMEFGKDNWLACDIGVLNPNNGKFGSLRYIRFKDGKMQPDSIAIVDSLTRPVQVTTADLNKDGRPDYLICEFGYVTGSLSWMENRGNGKYNRHVLRPLPGAIKAYVQDYNGDGLPDIWVLFAQGEEGIFLFTNKGNGQFSQEEVLRFPPVYGSSYFEMDDFNKDGYPDIVYTCGDNADYSPVLKPYHGVYIFMNDGHNHFKQEFFFPINGCYKAIARDFDGDGDLDIATIAHFADFRRQPEEGFVYLENKGHLQFEPHSMPQTQAGRWLTMDAGDLDGDGKTDLLLGNFSIGPVMIKSAFDWKKGPPFILLKNRGK